jgi:putative intracellular protease/amidase
MTVYLYLLNTLADWEIGYLTAELFSKRYFADKSAACELVKVADTLDPITTMGGMRLTPDRRLDSVQFNEGDMLVLPGGDLWMNPQTDAVLATAKGLIEKGINVAAICGATVGLARVGALDAKKHTSNNLGYLKMICPAYKGEANYINEPAVCYGNLITASGLAPLEFAYEVLKLLKVFKPETLEAWFSLNSTKQTKYFSDLMGSLKA